jgi:uncharacterized protein (TIGR01777 family)
LTNHENQKIALLIGGSGFIGSALGEYFVKNGWIIHLLSRTVKTNQTAFPCIQYLWDGKNIPEPAFDGVTAVINLAGQGIADKAWTTSYRKSILESRVNSTRALTEALTRIKQIPAVVIQASAIGYYGMEGRSESCSEEASAGHDFLAEVATAWEQETKNIAKYTRLVVARIGLVFGWEGGALPTLWDIYASGHGGILGTGKQWMNWIHITDLVRFFFNAADSTRFKGIYNLVAPGNIDNLTFHQLLASQTPSIRMMKIPAIAVKMRMGDRADLVLKGPRVLSTKLSEEGFTFLFPEFSEALNELLKERTHSSLHYVKVKQWIPISIAEVWNFVSSADNLERITPPWLGFQIKQMSTLKIESGTRITYSLNLHGIPLTWQSHVSEWRPKIEFVDEQEKGPYRIWFHRHVFTELAGGTLIEDRVEYQIPLFPLGEVALPFVKKDLSRIFTYRKEAIAKLLCKSNVISQT